MGIPIFREPVSIDSKPATKNDPTATSRSSIRRQRTMRHPRPSEFGGTQVQPRRRPSYSNFPQATRDLLLGGLPNREGRSSRNQGAERSISRSQRHREHTQRVVRDAFRQYYATRRMGLPRESTLRFELPSPPWSTSDNSTNSPGSNGPNLTRPQQSSLTPRFAPAYPFSDQEPAAPSPGPVSRNERPSSGEDGMDTNMPLLRRVGHRSVTEANRNHSGSRHQSVDGLGDRQRSPSPADDNNENDTWETLLTTITPDEHLPSADSSFTSATASASNALSRSYGLSSSNISLAPSFNSNSGSARLVLDPYPADLFTCDLPSSDGSDTEEETESGRAFEGRRQSQHNGANTSNNSQGNSQTQRSQTSSNQSLSSQSSFSFPRDGSDPDLHQMQAILDRLARREDIPDEWWAAAGLSRSIGRRLGVNVDISSTGIGETPPNGSDGTL